MSVAYSFSKNQRDSNIGARSESPSPDQYETAKGENLIHDKAPEWTFGKSLRPRLDADRRPGPGSYDTPEKKMGGVQFGRSSSRNSVSPGIRNSFEGHPGPGSYDLVNLNKTPNYSMGSKFRPMKTDNVPGPGSYNNQNVSASINKNKSQAAFGSKSKRDLHSKTTLQSPGPGAYTPSKEVIKSKGPAFKFSKLSKDITTKDLSPGPSSYMNSEQQNKKQAGVTIGSRPKTANVSNTPGPGAYYNQNQQYNQSPSKSYASMISKAPRISEQNKEQSRNPGPGSYDAKDFLTKEKSPAVKFSQTNRKDLVSNDDKSKPGPGSYDYAAKETKGFKMGAKIEKNVNNNIPGPGSYNPNPDYIKEAKKSVKISDNKKMSSIRSTAQLLPGPGSYQVGRDFGKNAPKVSLKGRPQDNTRTDSPGPGAYDPSHSATKERTKTVKIQDASRQLSQTIDNVGPGSYQREEKFGSNVPSFTFGQRREQIVDRSSPGPGEYSANNGIVKSTSISYKQGKSKRSELVSKSLLDTPGPGSYQYDGRNVGKNVPAVSIRGKSPSNERNDSPGPGAYDPSHALLKESVKTFQMGTSKRSEFITKHSQAHPGPGQYQVDSPSKSPSYSFYPKREPRQDTSSPGPGEYDSSSSLVKERVRSYKISQTERKNIVSHEEASKPGPGAYDNKHKTIGSDSQKVSIRGRPTEKPKTSYPGPGQYDAQKQSKVVGPVISGQSQRSQIVAKNAREQPGPGSYQVQHKDLSANNGPKYTMKGRTQDKVRDEVPGPGSYAPVDGIGNSSSIIRDKSPNVKIGTSNRSSIVNKLLADMPGPGNYSQSSLFGKNAPSFTMKGKPDQKITEKSPGPCGYNPTTAQTKERVISYKISDSKRSEIVSREAQQNLGPGHYDSASRFGKDAPSFTFKAKPQESIDRDSPGPGHYDANYNMNKERVVTHSISKTQRKDIVSKERSESPGPGNYYSPSKFGNEGLKYTMGGKREQRIDSSSPGPGHYEALDSLSKERTPSYKMSKTQRTDIVAKSMKDLPGPGLYDQESKIGKSGPNYTMKGKPKQTQQEHKPGPGAYDPSFSHTKDRVISAKIDSKSKRSELVSKEEYAKAAPGQYYQEKKFGADAVKVRVQEDDDWVQFSMKGRPEDKQVNDIPGPGQYQSSQSLVKERVISHKISKSERSDLVSKEAKNMPGPGVYDSPHKTMGTDSRSFAMRGRPEEKHAVQSPGPGEYSPSDSVSKERVRTFQMSKTKRSDLVSKEEMSKLGPGVYDSIHKTIGKDSQSFTMRGKVEDKIRSDSPGPGAYEPQMHLTKEKVVTFQMSQSKRSDIVSREEQNKLGPGSYSSPHKTMGKDSSYVTLSFSSLHLYSLQ